MEKKYKDTVDSLMIKGKEDGTITYEEISNKLSEYSLDKDEIDDLYMSLGDEGIDIVDDDILDISNLDDVPDDKLHMIRKLMKKK